MDNAFISRCFLQMPVLLAIAGIAALSALLAKGQQIYEGKTTLEYSLSPVEVVANLSQLADKLKQCCAGEVKIPNTTKVTDPKSPSTIPYNGKISLKDFKDERISQPTTVAWLSLVSDDGCDISYTTGNGEKTDWLKEYGKGHDISKGRRDCPHVLKAGSYNFQIKYSQTYYNPKPGTSDLDGISLVVAPIVVDICIGEKSIPYSKSHLFLEKKTELRLAINKIYLAKGPSENSEDISITWEAQTYSKCPQRFNGVILACNHTFQPNNGAWKPIGKGPCITYTPTEAELIRVTIGDKSFYYEGIPNRLGEIYWAIRPCQGLPMANHHFLLFVPDDPVDSFDPVAYHYGLMYYGNFPFIEPPETREGNRLEELVIAIDTSGSCKKEIVAKFLGETRSILEEKENFFSRWNVCLIQCDSFVQDVTMIHSPKEWEAYRETIIIKGRGGTDFRPVFQKVEELRKQHVFRNLKALIYFTDGDGIYPEQKPDYETAFVFVRQTEKMNLVPKWAKKLLTEECTL